MSKKHDIAVRAGKKGARVKAAKSKLVFQNRVLELANLGLHPAQIAMSLDTDIQAVVDTLKLLTYAPNPYAKGVGIAAHGFDIARKVLSQDPSGIGPSIHAIVHTALQDTVPAPVRTEIANIIHRGTQIASNFGQGADFQTGGLPFQRTIQEFGHGILKLLGRDPVTGAPLPSS